MSRAIHIGTLHAPNAPGCAQTDGRCLPCSGVSGRAVGMFPCWFPGDLRTLSQVGVVSLKCTSRGMPFLCKAGDGGYRRNPDFSRPNKKGFSQRQNEERDGSESLEESEVFSSKNGSLPSTSKSQATSTPGEKERKILEEFRKVQAQLRARAAVKGGKKTESSPTQAKDKKTTEDSKTVSSLIDILKNHNTQQGKTNGFKGSGRGLTLDQPDQSGTFEEETSTGFLDSNNTVKEEVQGQESPPSFTRPVSSFRRKSPVHPVKFRPILADSNRDTGINGERKRIHAEPNMHESKLKMESGPIFTDEDAFVDALLDDETSDDEGDSEDDVEEQKPIVGKDWSAMKLQELRADGESFDDEGDSEDDAEEQKAVVVDEDWSAMKVQELRAVAKSRGMKGFSKLKKLELVELLSGGSSPT